jgi:hypothetical protein
MKIKPVLAMLAAVSAVAATPASATAHAPVRECGNYNQFVPGSPAGISNLTTRQVGCGAALSFAKAITPRFAYSTARLRIRRYTCTNKELHYYLFDERTPWP